MQEPAGMAGRSLWMQTRMAAQYGDSEILSARSEAATTKANATQRRYRRASEKMTMGRGNLDRKAEPTAAAAAAGAVASVLEAVAAGVGAIAVTSLISTPEGYTGRSQIFTSHKVTRARKRRIDLASNAPSMC